MPDILIIDDEAPIREIMRRTLEGSGYAVREAADGEAGLEAVRQRAPDLVISDLIMPEREGLETIQVLREEFPGVKILAVGGVPLSPPTPRYSGYRGSAGRFPRPVPR